MTLAIRKAPKARSIPAWGEAPGMDDLALRGLKARTIPASVPHVALVEINTVFREERPKLFLERVFRMMRFLRIDISNHRIQVARTNREGSITALPGEPGKTWRLRFQPLRGRDFQFLNQLRDTFRSGQTNREMNVIGNTTSPETFASGVACDSCEIGKQAGPRSFVQKRYAILRAENHMNQNQPKRLWHFENYRSGLQPSVIRPINTWGFAPGWYGVAPLALSIVVSTFILGCKSAPSTDIPSKSGNATTSPATPAPTYPPRSTDIPPTFKIFHHANGTFTLVTDPDSTDDEINALIWQLRDAAHTHTFDKLKISQKDIDARDPIVWFHIYRGSKCASEKYADGAPPCGASYHAAGDYTFGGYTNKEWDKGVLHHGEDQDILLWDSEAPYKATASAS